jgi:hypothetical protein
MLADAAMRSTPLMTLLPRHYHAGIVKHYPNIERTRSKAKNLVNDTGPRPQRIRRRG